MHLRRRVERAERPGSRTAGRTAPACALVALLLGALAIAGWVTGHLGLAALAPERIPMAPSTAILFILLGAATLLAHRLPDSARLRAALTALGGAASLVALAVLLGSSLGLDLSFEHPGIATATLPGGIPLGHMSPLTAALFLLTGTAFLLLLRVRPGGGGRGLASGLAAGGVLLGGVVLSLAYLLGRPLLYGGAFIPPALSTSLAFVALGSSILLLAIERARHLDRPADPAARRAAILFFWILALGGIGAIAGAQAYFVRYERGYRTSVLESLGAIADLKVEALDLWRRERMGDATLLRDNEALLELVRRQFDAPEDGAARAALRSWLDGLRTSYGYSRIALLDAADRERLALGEAGATIRDPEGARIAPRSSTGTGGDAIEFGILTRESPESPPRLALRVPLSAPAPEGRRSLGALVLTVDPETYLYPMLRRWPTPSRTAETLLVRREGDEVLFLNDLKFRDGAALRLRFPLSSPRLPAAMAARGISGEVEGIDYQGHPVLAALRAVPGSPWHLVARIDAEEALAPARERLWQILALLATLLLAAAGAAVAVWQRDAKAHFRALSGAQEALARSESTLRTIFESVGDGLVIADAASHRIVRANAAFLRLLGHPPEILETMVIEDLHPENERPRVLDAIDRQLRGELVTAPDLWVRRADGTLFAAAISATPLFLEGRPHVVAVFRDVSARRHSETRIAHLNSVLRAVRNVNQLITRERDAARLVQSACELLVEARGFGAVAIALTDESADRLTALGEAGERRAPLLPDPATGGLPEIAREALERRGPAIRRATERSSSGLAGPADDAADESPGEDRIALPIEQEGRRYGYLAASLAAGLCDDPEELDLLREVVQDVAFALRSIEAEKELENRERQLRQAQKLEAIGRLAGGVAHDFNNLLMVILGYCSTLLEALAAEDPRRRHVEEIATAGGRAAELTQQLLAFSRSQAFRSELLDLDQVVRGLESLLHRLLGEDIALETHLGAEGALVLGDRTRLEQVLMNLVVNAREAMPRGGKLTIAVEPVELDDELARRHLDLSPGSYVQLAVSDTGTGMDAATRAHIFEPFFTTKPAGTGTGLGLATVWGIVQQLRGGIWVYSEPGLGATFKIYLPRAAGEATVPLAAEQPPAESVRGSGEHLLVVEDEPALRALLAAMLGSQGYRVTQAADADEALAAIEREGLVPDLLLTDVVMPGRSGADLASELRQRIPELRVLYMSGYTDVALGERGVVEAGVRLLQKPFTSAELARQVAILLSERPG